MSRSIQIVIGDKRLTAELNTSKSAELFYQKLPLHLNMDRWGQEYYGDCDLMVNREPEAREEMEVGEIAIWPDGSALCIFFGPTPSSTDDKPRAISPVNPIGKINENTDFLKQLPQSIHVEVKKA